jgi:outer membrane lipoprotein SlyB
MYLYIKAKSKERLALIERGMDPNLANGDFWAQIGIIGGGAALGLIVGDKIPGGYGPLVAIILAGAGSLIYNINVKNKARRNR